MSRERNVVLKLFWICFGTSVIFITGVPAVTINSINGPTSVKNGSVDSVILDCNFTLEDKNELSTLVVKWFFQKEPQQDVQEPSAAYQWIPGKKPKGLGPLQGRLNLDYRASEQPEHMYRALQILNPTTDLSGEYKCQVGTFMNDDDKSTTMVVYVPEKDMKFSLKEISPELTRLECEAAGTYPRPQLSIKNSQGQPLLDSKVKTLEGRDKLFYINATVDVRNEDLGDSPVTFDCTLKIPDANYSQTLTESSRLGYKATLQPPRPQPSQTNRAYRPSHYAANDGASSTASSLCASLLFVVSLALLPSQLLSQS